MYCRGTSEAAEKFLANFQNTGKKAVKASLANRFRLCTTAIENFDITNENASAPQILLGISEIHVDSISECVSDVVLTVSKRVCSNHPTLFTISSAAFLVHEAGKQFLYTILSSATRDDLSNTASEAVFACWALSVRTAVHDKNDVCTDTPVFDIHCRRLLPGKIYIDVLAKSTASFSCECMKWIT